MASHAAASSPGPDAREEAFAEAQRVIARQMENLAELDQKSSHVMTLAATLLGALLAGVAVVAPKVEAQALFATSGAFVRFGLLAIGAGGVALVLALVYAIATYLKSDLAAGLRPEDLEAALVVGVTREAFLAAAVEAYADGIRENHRVNLQAAGNMRRTLRLFVTGIALATSGTIVLIGKVLGWFV